MDISAKSIANPATHKSGCAVVLVASGKKLSAAAAALDKANNDLLSAALKSGDITGALGDSLLLHATGNQARVLLLGVGKAGKLDAAGLRKFSASLLKGLRSCKTKDATLYLEELKGDKLRCADICEDLGRDLTAASYRYDETVSKPKPGLATRRVSVHLGKSLPVRGANAALKRGAQIGTGINTARELGNLPANICTPSYLANQARKLAREHSKLTTRVLEEKQMKELGMGALLSVSAGSVQPAKLIVMQYKGGKAKDKPQVLVGKGITFDSGGISIKPGAKMDEMKYDMCGAASVFGTVEAVASMGLPINLVALVAASENLPSGTATKPGDVVTSMSGQTIEILNTDAEGRLVLSDALTYAERFKPAAVIDIATLTGACVVALGSHATAVYSNSEKLAEQLLDAGTRAHDRGWRMPLWDDYQKQINTPFADMANIGGPGGGSITAACFLERFAKKFNWAHLDIAGTAWNSAPKAATGRPVAMLTRYLMDRAGIK